MVNHNASEPVDDSANRGYIPTSEINSELNLVSISPVGDRYASTLPTAGSEVTPVRPEILQALPGLGIRPDQVTTLGPNERRFFEGMLTARNDQERMQVVSGILKDAFPPDGRGRLNLTIPDVGGVPRKYTLMGHEAHTPGVRNEAAVHRDAKTVFQVYNMDSPSRRPALVMNGAEYPQSGYPERFSSPLVPPGRRLLNERDSRGHIMGRKWAEEMKGRTIVGGLDDQPRIVGADQRSTLRTEAVSDLVRKSLTSRDSEATLRNLVATDSTKHPEIAKSLVQASLQAGPQGEKARQLIQSLSQDNPQFALEAAKLVGQQTTTRPDGTRTRAGEVAHSIANTQLGNLHSRPEQAERSAEVLSELGRTVSGIARNFLAQFANLAPGLAERIQPMVERMLQNLPENIRREVESWVSSMENNSDPQRARRAQQVKAMLTRRSRR